MAVRSARSGARTKRLTLDLPGEVHKALKIRAAELDVPMAELLRELIGEALARRSTLSELAERRRPGPT